MACARPLAPPPSSTGWRGPSSRAIDIRPPGCSGEQTAERLRDIAQLDDELREVHGDRHRVLAKLRSLAERPCLAYLAPILAIPADATLDQLRDAWSSGLEDWLEHAARGFERDGDRLLMAVPRDIVPALTAAQQTTLAEWSCPTDAAHCARAAAYQLRAEAAFDREYERSLARFPSAPAGSAIITPLLTNKCDGTFRAAPPTFESWTSCIAAYAPRNRRYASGALRTFDRGWLVLRGKRGHYELDDELRAYDLATGAAYVVSVQYRMSSSGPRLVTAVGSIAPDQLRELAFVLFTRSAIVEVRTSAGYGVVPPTIPRELAGKPVAIDSWPQLIVTGSDQTQIAVVFTGTTRPTTTQFTWPHADNWINDYIVELVRVAEAGLVVGCAPAKLPSLAELRGPLAPPSSGTPASDLEHELDQLRINACRDAK